jgi:putative transposase
LTCAKKITGGWSQRARYARTRSLRENALEIMPDHIHLFLESDPSYSPTTIIKRIKGRLSHHLRKEFPELLKLPTLWTPSYFCSTAGNASTETIKKYIENQTNK